MDKTQVGPTLARIKQLMEQKSAINTGKSFSEYTNPGPMENNIYVPIREGGKGNISIQSLGGDIDVKGLSDIDYFNNLFFGGLSVPKQFFSFTDDNAGFSGGESLSLISSRYAKMVKRIQNTIIQALTDAINLMLLDKGLDSYINKFELQMVSPTTTEEKDRMDTLSTRINSIRDTMDLLADIDDPVIRLKITKELLSNVINDEEIISLLEDEIDKLEIGNDESASSKEDDFGFDDLGGGDSLPSSSLGDFGSSGLGAGMDDLGVEDSSTTDTAPDDNTLPSPADLGQDFTDNTSEF